MGWIADVDLADHVQLWVRVPYPVLWPRFITERELLSGRGLPSSQQPAGERVGVEQRALMQPQRHFTLYCDHSPVWLLHQLAKRAEQLELAAEQHRQL